MRHTFEIDEKIAIHTDDKGAQIEILEEGRWEPWERPIPANIVRHLDLDRPSSGGNSSQILVVFLQWFEHENPGDRSLREAITGLATRRALG